MDGHLSEQAEESVCILATQNCVVMYLIKLFVLKINNILTV